MKLHTLELVHVREIQPILWGISEDMLAPQTSPVFDHELHASARQEKDIMCENDKQWLRLIVPTASNLCFL